MWLKLGKVYRYDKKKIEKKKKKKEKTFSEKEKLTVRTISPFLPPLLEIFMARTSDNYLYSWLVGCNGV